MKKTHNEAATVEVLSPTWQNEDFAPALVQWSQVNPALDSVGRILHFHQLAIEAGKVSIAAALLVALELHKLKAQHPRDWVAWCEANLNGHGIKFGYRTADRYLKALDKTVGQTTNLYLLANASDEEKMVAVANYTKYTNYQSLYQIYQGEGIVAKSKLGGGDRGAGRKRKDVDVGVELDAIVNSEAGNWAVAKSALDSLSRLDAEKDFLRILSTEHLVELTDLLSDLSKKAAKILSRRLSGKELQA